jgi:hypothetical protein
MGHVIIFTLIPPPCPFVFLLWSWSVTIWSCASVRDMDDHVLVVSHAPPSIHYTTPVPSSRKVLSHARRTLSLGVVRGNSWPKMRLTHIRHSASEAADRGRAQETPDAMEARLDVPRQPRRTMLVDVSSRARDDARLTVSQAHSTNRTPAVGCTAVSRIENWGHQITP